MRRLPGGRWFVVAAAAGLIHAAASLYWTLGGWWLLDTVGRFALDMQREGAVSTRVLLGGITVAKAAGAVVPLVDHRHPPAHRWVRIVSWVGAAVLLVWGGVGMLGAWWALAARPGAWSDPAVLGHAFLWDPLFVVWAVTLGVALLRSRATHRSAARRPSPAAWSRQVR